MEELRLIRGQDLSEQTAQTPGMLRRTAIDASTVGARGMWMGLVTVEPGVRSGAHHHGDCESAIYVIRGRFRMRSGENLEHDIEAGPGDFVYVPPLLVHQEINVSDDEAIDCIVVRACEENIVVNIDLPDELLQR